MHKIMNYDKNENKKENTRYYLKGLSQVECGNVGIDFLQGCVDLKVFVFWTAGASVNKKVLILSI